MSIEIENEDGIPEFIDVNSQTTYGKSRKPTKGERQQIEDLKRYKEHYGDKGGTLGIPKENAFNSPEEAERFINEMIETYLTSRHGPRPN